MKTKLYTFKNSIILFILMNAAFMSNAQVMVNDTVVMGANYANEIYYSMANGEVKIGPRNTWDIAFRTNIYSSSILVNDGSGVVLYSYPKSDTSGFATMDTVGLSTWKQYFNDPEDWENGAFSRSQTGHPNYGWCVYNSITHNLHGDSLYIVKLRDGSLKKIFVYLKNSITSTYYFKFANMDGSAYHDITLDCGVYNNKEFVGYDLQTNAIVDYEAPKEDWDILFTKYMSVQPNGAPYPVTGALSNLAIGVEEYWQVDSNFMAWGSMGWDVSRQPIGWDWKKFSGSAWSIEDSLVYFVQDQAGDVYRLRFLKFGGSSSGKIIFETSRISITGISMNNNPASLELYPNPAIDQLNVRLYAETSGLADMKIFDMMGKLVYQGQMELNQGLNQDVVDVRGLKSGLYTVTIQGAGINITKKLVVN